MYKVFTTVLFLTVPNYKQLNGKRMVQSENEYYLPIIKNKPLLYATTFMNLKDMLSKKDTIVYTV